MTERNFVYIVLSEHETLHHVCIERAGNEWLQKVGTFSSRDRAESYAGIENDIYDDELRATEQDDPLPEIADPGSGLVRATEIIRERSITFSETQTTRQVESTHNYAGIASLADEILAALPTWLPEFPKGPTANLICQKLGADNHHVRRAMRELDGRGQAVMVRRKDSPSFHLIPRGYRAPVEELTAMQANVLAVLSRAMNSEGIAQITRDEMCKQAPCSKGTIQAVLNALMDKERIVEVARGTGTTPSSYRVIQGLAEDIAA